MTSSVETDQAYSCYPEAHTGQYHWSVVNTNLATTCGVTAMKQISSTCIQYTQQSLPVHTDQVHPLVAPSGSRVPVDTVSCDKDYDTTVMKKSASSLQCVYNKPTMCLHIVTRHSASTSMYMLTVHVRIMLPQQRHPCPDCKSAQ